MLFFSVMDTGALIFAYLKSQGIPYFNLGIGKGIGAVFGILGTYLTEMLHNKFNMGLELIGLITLWLFWISVAPSGIQFIAENLVHTDIFSGDSICHIGLQMCSDDRDSDANVDGAYVILVCMIVARLGLWAFDLAENQMMQERVRPSVRAQVNGVQMSVSEGFTILMSAFAMLFHATSDFYILLLVTLSMIFGACVVYTSWYCCCSGTKGKRSSKSRSHRSARSESSNNEMRFSETSATRASRYLT